MDLFGKRAAEENKRLSAELAEARKKIESLMSPDEHELEQLKTKLTDAKEQLDLLNAEVRELTEKRDLCKKETDTAKIELVETRDEILLQSFGLYAPKFEFATSSLYKDKLTEIRQKQKEKIKNGTAAYAPKSWYVDGSASKGEKMMRDMKKLFIRAFNSECDDCVEHVKFNNIEMMEKRIQKSRDTISNLGKFMQLSISDSYCDLKIQELHLAYEYQVKKQEEKEAAREEKQRQREEAKVAKELEEARKKLEKEQSHYDNALAKLCEQLSKAKTEEDQAELEAKKQALESQLAVIDRELKDVDYRAANIRAGYVYIISNIGAFGEDIYKIGMTRRLDPMDRVYELGDASVPFNFDVHAMIFTDDAPGLEAALHNAFSNRKLNFVNHRREFFNVTLDEIKEVVRENFDKTVEFIDVAPAEQYRESLKMREQLQ